MNEKLEAILHASQKSRANNALGRKSMSEMNLNNGDGWDEYKIFILQELKRLNESYDKLADLFQQSLVEQTRLKVLASFWGMLGGALAMLLAIGIYFLQKAN